MMKRYLSLAIGLVAILGTLFFLLSGLLAIFVTFAGSAGLFPWSALIIVVAGTAFGLLSGCGAVLYFFFPKKIKLYYTFPAWISVSLLIFGLFIAPMLNEMKQERQVRAFVEQNDRGVAFDLSNVSLDEAIKLLEKYPQGDNRLRALEVIGKVTRHNHRADEILRKEVFNSLDAEARRVALEAFWESNQGFLHPLLEFDVCDLLDDRDPEIRALASKLLIKELPGHSKNLPPADLCRNYRAHDPLRSKSKKEGANTINKVGDTPLILAIRDGNLENVKALIAEGADVNLCDWYGRTPLFHALSKRIVDMMMIDFLVSRGADVNLHPTNSNTPLQESIRKKGMPGMSEFLINHGADVDVPPGSKIVPLNEAISSKNNDLIKLLLEKGVDVNVHDNRSRTLLGLAVKSGRLELAEVLLAKGADIDASDINGDSLLSWSLAIRKNDVVEFLIHHGADIKATNRYGKTPLDIAIKEENLKLTETLISRGADVNSEYLFPAIRKNNMTLVKLLISSGADVNVVSKNGSTPLNLAFFLKNKTMIYLLLEKGADVNANDKKGQTPLHIISTSSGSSSLQEELIEELISRGANVNARTNQGETPYKLAATRGRRNIAGLLRSKGGLWKSPMDFELVEAVRNLDLDMVKTLVFEGADVNVRDIETEFLKGKRQDFVTMPLMIAVEAGDYDIAKFLIDKGAGINVIWIFKGKTLLCTAIGRRNKELVELLLARGADPNKKCRIKKAGKGLFTPLRSANLLGYRDIAKLLTASGAVENQRTKPTGTNVEITNINSRKTTGSDLEE
jgi:ankyrin repeat protein